jgi:hypothetical protein
VGISVVGTFLGGFALFGALNIVHFWYGEYSNVISLSQNPTLQSSQNIVTLSSGFSRYTTHGADVLQGKATNPEFEQMRDICSLYSHGDTRRRNQTGAVLVSIPFTAFNYFVASLVLVIDICLKKNKDTVSQTINPPAPSLWGVYSSNVMVTCMWLAGGPPWMAFAALNLLFNQHLYNSLLFRRGFDEFLISVVLGNFVAIHHQIAMTQTDAPAVVEHNSICDSSEAISSDANSQHEHFNVADKLSPDKRIIFPNASSTTDSSLFEGLDDGVRRGNSTSQKPSKFANDADIAIGDKGQGTEQCAGKTGGFDKPLASLQVQECVDARSYFRTQQIDVNELHFFDVYFGLEGHPGTQAWRHAILEVTQKLPGNLYTQRKHDFAMRKLTGRKFFLNVSSTWQQVNKVEVRDRCRAFFMKQLDLQKQISNLSKELHDLKREKVKSVERKRKGQDEESVGSCKRGNSHDDEYEATAMDQTKVGRKIFKWNGVSRLLRPKKSKRRSRNQTKRVLNIQNPSQPTSFAGKDLVGEIEEVNRAEEREEREEPSNESQDSREGPEHHNDTRKKSQIEYSPDSIHWREEASQFLKETNQQDVASPVLKKWMAEQTRSRRFRSKFFSNLWNRATKRQGQQRSSQETHPKHQESPQTEDSPQRREPIATIVEEDHSTIACTVLSLGFLGEFFVDAQERIHFINVETKDVEVRRDDGIQAFTRVDGKESREDETNRINLEPEEHSMIDHLMEILEEDFLKCNNSTDTDGITLQDSESTADESASLKSLENNSSLWSEDAELSIADSKDQTHVEGRVDPASLFDFIAKKMSEEYFDFKNCAPRAVSH